MSVLDVSLEEATDVFAEVLLSREFADALEREYARRRRKMALRIPEWVYTEDVESPDGYPCCELIAITVDDNADATAQELSHEISMQWTVNGDDPQIMGRELKRLISASRDCFRSLQGLPQIGGRVYTGRADFGPVVAARTGNTGVNGRWVKSASLETFWKVFARG